MTKNIYNILIIEDDLDIGNMIRMILEYRGYTVFILKNTEGVSELMKKRKINVVIIDMMLAEANGTDICIKLKKDASLAHIPLIMMSAHPDAENLCRISGADDFISKPFDLDQLLLKIGNFTS